MRVYHLCGTQFAVSNIALRRLKISRFMDMNDPFEMWVNTKNANRRQAFLRSKAVMNEKKGCLCFSKSWRDPVYWAHYAEKHFGMALGFDIADEWLTDISYVDEPPDGDKEPDINLMRQWLLSKFTGWQYEEEVRAMVDLDPSVRQGGLYFLEFSDKLVFREIILGVRCQLPLNEVSQLASTYGHPISVIKARLAHDSYSIVEDDQDKASPA